MKLKDLKVGDLVYQKNSWDFIRVYKISAITKTQIHVIINKNGAVEKYNRETGGAIGRSGHRTGRGTPYVAVFTEEIKLEKELQDIRYRLQNINLEKIKVTEKNMHTIIDLIKQLEALQE